MTAQEKLIESVFNNSAIYGGDNGRNNPGFSPIKCLLMG